MWTIITFLYSFIVYMIFLCTWNQCLLGSKIVWNHTWNNLQQYVLILDSFDGAGMPNVRLTFNRTVLAIEAQGTVPIRVRLNIKKMNDYILILLWYSFVRLCLCYINTVAFPYGTSWKSISVDALLNVGSNCLRIKFLESGHKAS